MGLTPIYLNFPIFFPHSSALALLSRFNFGSNLLDLTLLGLRVPHFGGQQPGMTRFMVFLVESFVRVPFNSIEASYIDAFFSSRHHSHLDGL